MWSNQYRSSPASIYMYWWVDRSTCLASRISTQKESFPGSEFKPASIWTCWMLIDRQMQSAFRHAGTSQVDFEVDRPTAAACPPGDLLITMVKETVILYKKSFEKWKKVVSLIDLKVMKMRNDCEIACDCVKRANVVLHVGLCKEIFARQHTATHKPTPAQPLIVTTMPHIHLTRSLVAVEPRSLLCIWQT